MNVLDLFCGCGGLSLGARQAGLTPVLSVDVDPVLSSTYQTNFGSGSLLVADLMSLEPSIAASKLSQKEIEAVIGGPPCQGFSVMGRQDADDPRNGLLKRFFEYVAYFRPRFFLMENVPGLGLDRNASVLKKALEVVPRNYKILNPMLLDAADFGAATSRKRLIVVGYDPLRCATIGEDELCKPSTKVRATVSDAISDLPEPDDCFEWHGYRANSSESAYARRMKKLVSGCGSFEALEQLKMARISGLQETKHTPSVVERFSMLAPGGRDPISKYQRLSLDRPSHVLRAGTGVEKGSFQAARPIHPTEPRVITVREAARLQGFPDWFQFHHTKWHSHRMIGNSVCPPFAKVLLGRMKAACRASEKLVAAE